MVTTLTPVSVLLDSLEQIVKQVITCKLDLFSKFSDLLCQLLLCMKWTLHYLNCLLYS